MTQPEWLSELVELAVADGEDLLVDGVPTSRLYVLVSGTVRVHKDGLDIDRVERPGTFLGEMATLLGGAPGTIQTDVYDPSGALLYQNDSVTGATLYLGDTQLHVAPGGGLATGIRTYSDAGTPVAERASGVSGVNKVVWLCASPNNTSSLELDTTSQGQARRYFDPYGNLRGTAPTWSSDLGIAAEMHSGGSWTWV